MALVDWDQDGDLDVWYSNRTGPRVRFYRNDLPSGQHYCALRLTGTQCNRDAIGARVEVYLKSTDDDAPLAPLLQTVRAGEGFLSQSSKWLHFGLGKSTAIERVVIRWPGQTEPTTLMNLEADRRYHVIQGRDAALVETQRTAVHLQSSTIVPPAASDEARTILFNRRSFASRQYTDINRHRNAIPAPGRIALVNLWATWCSPCLLELQDLSEHHVEFQSKGIDIVALCTDLLPVETSDAPSTDPDTVARFIRQANYPFAVGYATQEIVSELADLHNQVYYAQRPLPLPCSFLVDSAGRIAAIYKGPVAAEQLIRDIALLEMDTQQIADETLPFPGQRLQRGADLSPLATAEAYREGGYLEEAVAEVQRYLQEVTATRDLDEMATALLGALRPPSSPENHAVESSGLPTSESVRSESAHPRTESAQQQAVKEQLLRLLQT